MSRYVRHTLGVGGEDLDVSARETKGGIHVRMGDHGFDVGARVVRRIDGGVELAYERDGKTQRVFVVREDDGFLVAMDGRVRRVEIRDPAALASHDAHADGGDPFVVSPMTGVVLKVQAEPGQRVEEGAPLVVVEAMKMEFVIEAPRETVVDDVLAAVGDRVEIGQTLVTFADPEEAAPDDAGSDDAGSDDA